MIEINCFINKAQPIIVDMVAIQSYDQAWNQIALNLHPVKAELEANEQQTTTKI